MFKTQNLTKDPVIAGFSSGKLVRITPAAKPVYDELFRLAQQGNHWARLTVKGINELVAGRLHQNNIFVHPSAKLRNGVEEFVMILPGCKVTVEKLDEDGFRVLYFEADLNYTELQKNKEKPALYESEMRRGSWVAEVKADGRIKRQKRRYVGVTDSKYSEPQMAAQICASRIKGTLGHAASDIDSDGFDMHFTPGNQRIGGLINYKQAIRPLGNKDLNETALLLAKTMHDAKNIENVKWYAEFGGSGVLTQAMKILVDQGVNLEGHTIYLINPRTSPNEAFKLASTLKLTVGRHFSETGAFDYIGNRDQLELIGNRLKLDKEYSIVKAGADLWALKSKLSAWGPLLAAVGITTVTASSMPALMAYLGVVAAASATVIGGGKTLNTVVKQALPDTHTKIKSKF